jgi:hypothetical protein
MIGEDNLGCIHNHHWNTDLNGDMPQPSEVSRYNSRVTVRYMSYAKYIEGQGVRIFRKLRTISSLLITAQICHNNDCAVEFVFHSFSGSLIPPFVMMYVASFSGMSSSLCQHAA